MTTDDQLYDLAKTIAHRRGLTLADLRGTRRTRPLVDARAEFAHAGHALGASYPQLGRIMDKDHSTMILAARRWGKKLEKQ